MDQTASSAVTMNAEEPRPDLPKVTSDNVALVFGIMAVLTLLGGYILGERIIDDYVRIMTYAEAIFGAAFFGFISHALNYLKRISERLEWMCRQTAGKR